MKNFCHIKIIKFFLSVPTKQNITVISLGAAVSVAHKSLRPVSLSSFFFSPPHTLYTHARAIHMTSLLCSVFFIFIIVYVQDKRSNMPSIDAQPAWSWPAPSSFCQPHSWRESINLTIYNIDAPQLSSLAQFISRSPPCSHTHACFYLFAIVLSPSLVRVCVFVCGGGEQRGKLPGLS